VTLDQLFHSCEDREWTLSSHNRSRFGQAQTVSALSLEPSRGAAAHIPVKDYRPLIGLVVVSVQFNGIVETFRLIIPRTTVTSAQQQQFHERLNSVLDRGETSLEGDADDPSIGR
jgi:hypothetical protein